jgi:acetyltransferase
VGTVYGLLRMAASSKIGQLCGPSRKGHAMLNPDPQMIISADLGGNVKLHTRGGITMDVRAVLPTDAAILADLFDNVSPMDLRFRFLSGLRHVDAARIAQMVDVDYRGSITFIAFEGERPIATAMLAAGPDRVKADVAVTVRSDMKNRGIGWTLLQHVLRYARANGIEHVESMESRDNAATLGLERDAGFAVYPCEGDPADVIASKKLVMD